MIVYLDDILIFTLTLEEHYWAVQRVLKVLAEHKLFLHFKKCEFDKQQIEYLKLVIAQDQVEIDLVKVAETCNWPILYNHTDLQIFLSFVNFYQKFIHSFLDITHFLFNFTGSNSIWTWTTTQKNTFDALKAAITLALILVFSDTFALFQIKVESLDFVTEAVLFQKSKADGKWHLVAFFSKSLSLVECNYEIHNKKILAIIWALEELQHFLEKAPNLVEIWTDYWNLKYFMTAKKLNWRQAQ